MVSDIHSGKSAHFRKAGIPISREVENDNLNRLDAVLEKYNPESLIILGDLFHSKMNIETESWFQWRKKYSGVRFILVRGNHDKEPDIFYSTQNIEVVAELRIGNLLLTHKPFKGKTELYNIYGHLHPSYSIKGFGNMNHRTSCFLFGKKGACIPAFGGFTGLFDVKMNSEDTILAIIGKKLFKFPLEI